MELKLEVRNPEDHPRVEELVIIFIKDIPVGEMGTWDGQAWVDQNGYEREIVGWAHFPMYRKPEPRRLLIVSCSATKDKEPGKIWALHRYTGAFYGVMNSFKQYGGKLPETVILSAEHGFISSSAQIEDYDRRMTPERAAELAPCAAVKLGALLRLEEYDEVFIAGGKEYRDLILPTIKKVQESQGSRFKKVRTVRGGIGEQKAQLKAWLRGDSLEGAQQVELFSTTEGGEST